MERLLEGVDWQRWESLERRAFNSKLKVLFSKGKFLFVHTPVHNNERACRTGGFHADTMNRYILFFGRNADGLSLFKDVPPSVLIEPLGDGGRRDTER